MNNVEESVAVDLKDRGYSVYNIEPVCHLYNKASDEEEKSLMAHLSNEIGSLKFESGAPDLLVFDVEQKDSYNFEVKEAFFVEVKSENDSLKMKQLDWISQRHSDDRKMSVPVYVAKVGSRHTTYTKLSAERKSPGKEVQSV